MSTSQQDVQSQADRVREYLKGKGITGARWFVDQASGTTMVRPKFGDLQNCIFDGQIKRVVMYSLDRMSRVLIDGLIEIEKWRKAGVSLVFVDDCLEINASVGDIMGDVFIKIMVSMKLAFAEAEREKLRRRQRHGIDSARRKMAKAKGMRAKGMPIADIALKLNTPIRIVERMCRAKPGKLYWGSEPGARRGYRKAGIDKAYRLHQKGLSYADIGKTLGVSASTAHGYVAEEQYRIINKKKTA